VSDYLAQLTDQDNCNVPMVMGANVMSNLMENGTLMPFVTPLDTSCEENSKEWDNDDDDDDDEVNVLLLNWEMEIKHQL